MVLGWRRAFCTSFPRDRDTKEVKEKQEHSSVDGNPSPRFGFFSNPSTPRFRSQSTSSPGLRCRTTATVPSASASLPGSPKLKCKTRNTPSFFSRSNPSSPRSPSTFSLLKSSLRFTKNRCGICLLSVKTGQGMAIFTAECSHSFHFPCISSHVKKQSSSLVCPVCSVNWKEMPLLSSHSNLKTPAVEAKQRELASRADDKRKNHCSVVLKVYNDDEPLMSPTTRARFNPIPESDEENDTGTGEFQGFFVNATTSPIVEPAMNIRNVDFKLLPEVAVVSVSRGYETHAIVLKVRAPPLQAKTVSRAPIDLVTVIDVSMNNDKLQMMKRAMRLVVSSLSSSDRLSIVAFSTNSKRLLPLRRMTMDGRRAARRIIEAIAVLDGTSSSTDALKKAAKVLEDRREKNTVSSIMLFYDDKASTTSSGKLERKPSFVSSTRYPQLEIPVHSISFNQTGACGQSFFDDSFAKSVGGLISVVVQDIRLSLGFLPGSGPAEIAAVYSYVGRPVVLGSGSIRIGDLYADEERELLVELKVPSTAIAAQHIISVRSTYRDPSTQQLIHGKEQALLVPKPHAGRSSTPSIQRLRSLFVATRAVAESRKLVERNDSNGAQIMLSSARALLLQSKLDSAEDFARGLEAELSELNRRRQNRSRTPPAEREMVYVDEKGEPLTPTSAWRAAERLAKVAIMRKSLNRVSDLHGFEDARF